MNCIHGPKGPVTDIKRFLVFSRKLCSITKINAHRGTWADINHCWKTIYIMGRPFTGATSPTKFTATRSVIYSCRAIPRHPHIPFHICIVDKHFAICIQSKIIFIPVATANNFPIFAIGISLCNIPTGGKNTSCMAVGIPLPWKQMVFAPIAR